MHRHYSINSYEFQVTPWQANNNKKFRANAKNNKSTHESEKYFNGFNKNAALKQFYSDFQWKIKEKTENKRLFTQRKHSSIFGWSYAFNFLVRVRNSCIIFVLFIDEITEDWKKRYFHYETNL